MFLGILGRILYMDRVLVGMLHDARSEKVQWDELGLIKAAQVVACADR